MTTFEPSGAAYAGSAARGMAIVDAANNAAIDRFFTKHPFLCDICVGVDATVSPTLHHQFNE